MRKLFYWVLAEIVLGIAFFVFLSIKGDSDAQVVSFMVIYTLIAANSAFILYYVNILRNKENKDKE